MTDKIPTDATDCLACEAPPAAGSLLSESATLAAAPVIAPRPLPTLSCVVPCYNEADSLPRLLPLLLEVLPICASDFEIIFVDDGSTGATAPLLARFAQFAHVRVLQLSRNFGKEAALSAGLEAARGDVVALIDADLQHAPALIPRFVEHWRNGADVVYAVRERRDDEPAFKRFGARLFYRLINAGERFAIPAGAGDFRLMDRRVVTALLAMPERNRMLKGLYAWVGFDAVAIPYAPEPRRFGHSSFSRWRLLLLGLDGLTAFTTLPLRALAVSGFAMALSAFLYGAWLSVSHLVEGNPVSGWTTIVVCLLGFSGLQMLSLGVIGEYIGRIYEEVKARPLYVLKHEFGLGLAKAP